MGSSLCLLAQQLFVHLPPMVFVAAVLGRVVGDPAAIQGADISAGVQCEMDPLCEVNLRSEIEASGLKVVGWYHSHPTFEPIPSQCDIDNQCNYQVMLRSSCSFQRGVAAPAAYSTAAAYRALVVLRVQAFFRHHASNTDPFVGLILSPYDYRLPSMLSASTWFNVASPQTDPTPMIVEIDELTVPAGDVSGIPDDADALLQSVTALAPTFVRSCSSCVDPHEIWRELMGAVSHIAKLQGSLLARFECACVCVHSLPRCHSVTAAHCPPVRHAGSRTRSRRCGKGLSQVPLMS
jgi:hypothetical protein